MIDTPNSPVAMDALIYVCIVNPPIKKPETTRGSKNVDITRNGTEFEAVKAFSVFASSPRSNA